MRVVDLSQPLSRESQLHPFFSPTQILRHIQHTDSPEGRPSFNAEIIITSNHAATHVDAFGHYQKGGVAIAEMPLDTFCGDALCVDIRQYPGGHDVTAAEVERAVADSGQELRDGDILLFCSDHYNRTAGTPAFLDGFNGISAEAVHWMADRGVKIFGVETISPDLVYLTDEYPTHRACARARTDPLREPEQPGGGRGQRASCSSACRCASTPPTGRRCARPRDPGGVATRLRS